MDKHIHSEKFRLKVEELMRTYHVPGLTVAVTHDGLDDAVAFGYADVGQNKKCHIDNVFDIASSSKSLTAAAVGLMVSDKRYPEVQYEAKMSDLLPEDFVMAPGYEDVTLEDILSHRTGMADHYSAFLGVNASQTDTPRSVTRNLRNLQPVAPIRTEFIYCNMMYTVATHLIEVKTGKPFSDFLEKNFFSKLGMTTTALQPSGAKAKGFCDKMARGHVWDKEKNRFVVFDALESPEAQGAGCIMSSAPDYLKWVKALVNRQYPVTKALYRGLTKARSITRPWLTSPKKLLSPDLYASGLEAAYYRGYQMFGHDGAVDGFGSRHFWVPAFGLGCVVLGNGTDTGDIGNIIQLHLVDEILGVPDEKRVGHSDDDENEPDDEERDDNDETLEKAVKRLYPGVEQGEQKMPLHLYTGNYSNAGYRGLKVQILNGKLFIDANDRSLPLELTLFHVNGQTSFVARQRLGDAVGGTWEEKYAKVEFQWNGDEVVKLGVNWEERVAGGMIWFHRIEGGT